MRRNFFSLSRFGSFLSSPKRGSFYLPREVKANGSGKYIDGLEGALVATFTRRNSSQIAQRRLENEGSKNSSISISALGPKQQDQETNESEVQDAQVLFYSIWNKLEKKYGKENLRFPKEIIWLMGAPGSGKSYNAPWILKARGIETREISMSSLLSGPDFEKLKKGGHLVSDSQVLEILLETLLLPQYSNGVVIDGFPRTMIQAECIKLLRDEMLKLSKEFQSTPLAISFKRPIFRVGVLYVDEKESVRRQILRGNSAKDHNKKVRETGVGTLVEERDTDFDEERARARYRVFRENYGTIQELRKHFPFSIINTTDVDKPGGTELLKKNVMKEFIYQSSLELGEGTYLEVEKIPLAVDVIKNARQNLIQRLDSYYQENLELFQHIVHLIKDEFIPIVKKSLHAGEAIIRTDNQIFLNSIAIDMALDILSERGYNVMFEKEHFFVPKLLNSKTGEIECSCKITFTFKVGFKKPILRQDTSDYDPTIKLV